ncbi:unnamed protein product [Closterium sp. NIES-65]|nr:unnamed protein product [Closterium sp. NIES-65]
MSERSNYSYNGPRPNPLYGGPKASKATSSSSQNPSWVRREPSASHAYSDSNCSPGASPARSNRSGGGPYYAPQYENPGYTVETPGHYNGFGTGPGSVGGSSIPAASPYRPTASYFVQTPAHSDRAGLFSSPGSSAPSSPRFGDEDARSMRSGRGGASVAINGGDGDDDYDDFYPDHLRDADRRRKWWIAFWAYTSLIVGLLLVAGAIVCWIIFQPTEPTYTFDYVAVNQFTVYQDMLDGNGMATDHLYANMTFIFSIRNPNTRFNTWFDGGDLSISYHNMANIMKTTLPTFQQEQLEWSSFNRSLSTMAFPFIYLSPSPLHSLSLLSPFPLFPSLPPPPHHQLPTFQQEQLEWSSFNRSLSTMAFPLYAGGTFMRADMAEQFVPLKLNATLNSHVDVAWKIIQPKYSQLLECVVNINPASLQYINDTCTLTMLSKKV